MDSDIASRKLFIGGLSYGTDDDKLRNYFEQYGVVQDAVVMKDPVTRRSRGFGFITYTHPSHVDQALAVTSHVIDSRKVEAKRAVPRHEVGTRDMTPAKSQTSNSHHSNPNGMYQNSPHHMHNDSHISNDEFGYCKIFVGGLHYDTRDGEFRHYFEKYGKVISAEVMFNRETHKSRGFGFIIFDNEASVDRVCDERDHSIDGKMVEVKRAVPRSKIGLLSTNPPAPVVAQPAPPVVLGPPLPSSTSKVPPAKTQSVVSTPVKAAVPQSPQTTTIASNPPPPISLHTSSAKNSSATNTNPGTAVPASSTTKKQTPGTPPSYAAAVISGPQNNASNSPQNSPQISSPSLGPIGSPSLSNSFGLMLPPLHSASVSLSGANSLNSSAHGGGNNSYVQSSPYRSHSSSFSDGLDQPQPLGSKSFNAPANSSAQSHVVLLQHQEQFPPPSSPVRSVTTNYVHSEQPSSQFPGYSNLPNSTTSTARHRALSESYLFMPQKSALSFPFQLNSSLKPSELVPSPEKSSSELSFSNLNHIPENSTFMDGSESSPHDDIMSSPSHSSWNQTHQSPNGQKWNREKELESFFTSNRQDIERSVSLGGWMPSSLSHHHFSPPSSKRGFSDLGIGIGFGGGIEGHEVAIGLGLSEPLADFNVSSPNQVPSFIPSMSAWESFIDVSTNGAPTIQTTPTTSPPRRPHSYSLGHLSEGLTMPSNLRHSSLQSNNISATVSTTGSNSVLSCDDDDNFGIQELRLQAPEYTPSNSLHGTSSPTWLSR